MTELLLIRHAETDWNRQMRFQGHSDVPLNARGQAQAARLAQRLADEPIDIVLSSDLTRARETAAPLVDARGLALHTDRAWREQAFGLIEGLDAATIQARHPDVWAAWLRHDADLAPPGGESNRAFHARAVQALRDVARAADGRRVAVFTHGGVLDMRWREVHGLPLSGPRQCAIPNTGLNRLQWDGRHLRIAGWGDASHLEGLVRA